MSHMTDSTVLKGMCEFSARPHVESSGFSWIHQSSAEAIPIKGLKMQLNVPDSWRCVRTLKKSSKFRIRRGDFLFFSLPSTSNVSTSLAFPAPYKVFPWEQWEGRVVLTGCDGRTDWEMWSEKSAERSVALGCRRPVRGWVFHTWGCEINMVRRRYED